MASLEFNIRFKNKFTKIGKEGYLEIDSLKAIEKVKIPENKLHEPYLRLLPSASKGNLASKSFKSSNKTPDPTILNTAHYNYLPQITISPLRNEEFYPSRSKSPRLAGKHGLYRDSTKPELSKGVLKLPRLNSKLKITEASLRSKINH